MSQRIDVSKGADHHIDALDGVRGVAVLLVIFHHVAGTFPNQHRPFDIVFRMMTTGWIGVDLFFVLSGFLITGILTRTKTAENRAKIFYARRALRILPIYYLTLLIIIPLVKYSTWAHSMFPWSSPVDIAALCLYFQDWIPYWHSGQFPGNIVGHFWSLGVEENFYMLWPWLIWVVPNRFHLRMCVIGIAVFFLAQAMAVAVLGMPAVIYAIPARGFDALLVGSALAVFGRKGTISKRALTLPAAAGLCILAAIGIQNRAEFLVPGRLIYTSGILGCALIFGALVVACSQFPASLLAKAMSFGWLRRIGIYSYGMYVYHVPLFLLEHHFVFGRGLHASSTVRHQLFFLAFAVGSTYCSAWASFRLIEEPLLRFKKNFRPHYRTVSAVAVPV